MRRPTPWFLALLLASSLGPMAEAAVSEPPSFRLSAGARPFSYAVDLTIDPTKDDFQGVVDIEVELAEPASIVWLNAIKLVVTRAAVSAGGQTVEGAVIPGPRGDFIGVQIGKEVPAGRASLHIEYRGVLNRLETVGVFKEQERGDWYVFTQFEATDARRAFPCFDEPGFKTPFRLTLRVPAGCAAVSNTPVVADEAGESGLHVVRFAETKPLPSYLVAFGVGPFEFVEAGKAGSNATPVRIVVPRGRSGHARFAAEMTPRILELLEDYFGRPFPYEKLDSLAVPQTVGFGAMENPGLITYRVPTLLVAPQELTPDFEHRYAAVCLHEVAHQWFGDLVTMKWWDDVWLNESFATWIGSRLIGRLRSEWNGDAERALSRSRVMGDDSLMSARRIREPVLDAGDIETAFDGITYSKGASVLAMFEASMGEAAFQRAIRRYLGDHAHGNACAEDFLLAIAAEGGPSEAVATFINQTGVPLVTAEVTSGSPSLLRLSQRLYLPLGSSGTPDRAWQIPISVKYRSAGELRHTSVLLKGTSVDIPLEGSPSPEWVLVNAGATGYYRTLYSGDLMQKVITQAASELTPVEKIVLLEDAYALARSGDLPISEALRLVRQFARDPNLYVVRSTIGIVKSIRSILVTAASRERFARFVDAVYAVHARELRLESRAGESYETRSLRSDLIALVGRYGTDTSIDAQVGRLARTWIRDRQAVPSDLAETVLAAAAAKGDPALFDAYRDEVARAVDLRDRRHLYDALGGFTDPVIAREALALMLDPKLDARESSAILPAVLEVPETREQAFDFVRRNYDQLVQRLPDFRIVRLADTARAFCDETDRDEVERFFLGRIASVPGAPRVLNQGLESAALCRAMRETQSASLAQFLQEY